MSESGWCPGSANTADGTASRGYLMCRMPSGFQKPLHGGEFSPRETRTWIPQGPGFLVVCSTNSTNSLATILNVAAVFRDVLSAQPGETVDQSRSSAFSRSRSCASNARIELAGCQPETGILSSLTCGIWASGGGRHTITSGINRLSYKN